MTLRTTAMPPNVMTPTASAVDALESLDAARRRRHLPADSRFAVDDGPDRLIVGCGHTHGVVP